MNGNKTAKLMRYYRVAACILVCSLSATIAVAQPISKKCKVAIDVGHSEASPGSTSARGIREYFFNRTMAELLFEELRRQKGINAFIIDGNGVTLQQRTQLAEDQHATIFLSLHHDSVQPQYLSTWSYNGKEYHYSDRFHGFSLFISEQNQHAKQSLSFAESLGAQLVSSGFTPTLHHAEKIPGESRTLLDSLKGIYAFNDLIVLKTATIPAVLLECGVIVNRGEELNLTNSNYQIRMVQAIAAATERSCRRPSYERSSRTRLSEMH